MVLKKSIINLSSYRSKSYASVVLSDSEVTFLEDREVKTICSFLFSFVHRQRCIIEEVCHQISLSFLYFVIVYNFSAFNFLVLPHSP